MSLEHKGGGSLPWQGLGHSDGCSSCIHGRALPLEIWRPSQNISRSDNIYQVSSLCGAVGAPQAMGVWGCHRCGAGRGCAALLAAAIFPKISRKLPRAIFKPCSCEPSLFNRGFRCHFLPLGLLSSCLNGVSRPQLGAATHVTLIRSGLRTTRNT